MTKKNKDENGQNLNRLELPYSVIPPLDHEPTIAELIAEGVELLKKDECKKPNADKTKLETALSKSSKNPYIRARVKVLESMPDWKRREVGRMEQTGNIHNRFYDEFVTEVRLLGDILSNK